MQSGGPVKSGNWKRERERERETELHAISSTDDDDDNDDYTEIGQYFLKKLIYIL